jgi:cytochrome c-type biogenesis protein CcmF
LKVIDLTEGDTPNYQWETALLDVSKNGEHLGTLEPSRQFYKAAQQATAVIALRSRLNEDLYINYAARTGNKATLQAYVFPLVDWIWIGVLVLVGGTLVALVPAKVARSYARTEVVGVAQLAVAKKDGSLVAQSDRVSE